MTTKTAIPSKQEMYRALVERDAEYEGVFFVGVRTTGVFCRPTCTARKPKPANVEYFRSTRDAVAGGYRPCKVCRPLQPAGAAPEWLAPLLRSVETSPAKRWTDRDLATLNLEPKRVRRWFKSNHGMTFQAYSRARRLGLAMDSLKSKENSTTEAAYEYGFESLSGFRRAFRHWFGDAPTTARSKSAITVARILSPLGPMIAAATERGVCLLEFAERRMLETQIQRLRKLFDAPFRLGTGGWLEQLESELAEYFAGSRRAFDVPLDLKGTEFQERVWGRLLKIPHGRTLSYEALAREIGVPNGQRAVGRANGDNRVAILVPCHRVIRRDGTLCGYGGGLWRKEWLIEHEIRESSVAARRLG
jgi:AraC family transcriptional regulator of adaptative response/methylated-DNA-[protein]-cysteine methyltransferase